MRADETELQVCVRHVAERENRIARQEALIECLREVRAPLLDDAIGLLGENARPLGNDARSRCEVLKLG
jgi:hypothetical protein